MITAQELGLNPEQYRVFEGIYREIMPELRRLGFEPWGPADIMDAQHATVDTRYEEASWGYKVDTDFGIVGTPEKVYVLPHSPRLQTMTPRTKLVGYGIPLPENDLPQDVKVYERGKLILNQDLRDEQARTHPLWLDFADGNQERLDRKVENTFRLGRNKYNYDTMMGIYVPKDNQPIEQALFLHRLYYRSRAYGYNNLGNYARLVGVRRANK